MAERVGEQSVPGGGRWHLGPRQLGLLSGLSSNPDGAFCLGVDGPGFGEVCLWM